ncbi:DUF4376 domain-containing protein [Pseudomonas sp. GV071]|jgi:hypothetical protein|uniref:DUF4376 domain-containing protein n=1 Tax=Pseudomonas sp. GV071 TaxID=2135754 RepID=UPI000D3BB63D|nr:DUF4376 domain-containing protein [Pseudomonas sp. GV071]PTQ70083.1 uncharacterized protein DUF4376 [Pseudomonas sp. GV071]
MAQQHFIDLETNQLFAYQLPGDEAFIKPHLVPLSSEALTAYRAEQAAALEPEPAQQIAQRRYEAEIQGIEFNGVRLDTGRDSQALINGAALAAVIDPGYVCKWKTESGFTELNATALVAIASAVRAHVQACFNREAELLTAVADRVFTKAMLSEGWPV